MQYQLEAIISYEKNKMPYFMAVYNFLNNPHTDRLSTQAQEIYGSYLSVKDKKLSEMVFERRSILDFIYQNFLGAYKGVYSRYNWLSIFWMNDSQVDEFRVIFDKVNAVLDYLKIPNRRMKIPQCEMILIEVLLLEQVNNFHTNLCSDPVFEKLAILINDRPRVRCLDNEIRIYPPSEFYDLYAENGRLIREVEDKSKKIDKLLTRVDDLIEKNAEIMAFTLQLTHKNAEMAERNQHLCGIIAGQGEIINKNQDTIEKKNTTIARLENTIEESKTIISAKDAIISTLTAGVQKPGVEVVDHALEMAIHASINEHSLFKANNQNNVAATAACSNDNVAATAACSSDSVATSAKSAK